MSRATFLAGLAASLCLGGCCETDRQRWDYAPSATGGFGGSGTSGASTTPSLSVSAPSFPPFGPANPLVVTAHDAGQDLSTLEVSFREATSLVVSGGLATVEVPLAKLGEGRGTLHVRVRDKRGAFADWSRAGTVVDLRKPVIVPPADGVVKTGEPVVLWVADDWALGSYEVAVDDWVESHAFPAAWPATAGTAWDEAMVVVPGLLGDGWHDVQVTATDAAGNVATQVIHLDVDATPPSAKVLLPLAGAKLSGAAKILLSASDDRDTPVKLDVRLGGVPVAAVLGPSAEVGVDVTGFAKGPSELVVVPIDGAGNEGPPVKVPVVIE